MMNLKNLARRFRKDERGVTLVEYGIAVLLAVTLGAGALVTLAGGVGSAMAEANSSICDNANVECDAAAPAN